MSSSEVLPSSNSYPHPHPQIEVHFYLGPLIMNTAARNVIAPELMALAMEPQEQARNPQQHQNELPVEAVQFDRNVMAEPEHVENLPAQLVTPLFHQRLVKKSKFVALPIETHIEICEWLSVSDILALRRTSKDLYKMTRNGTLWLSTLKRLNLLLPILPPASKYFYGEIKPFMAEYLTLRSLYLHENFAYRQMTGSLARQETYDRILGVRIVPGGKLIVALTENLRGEFCLSIWEMKLYKGGIRLPLVRVKLAGKQELFEVAYGTVRNESQLFIACASPAIQNETTLQFVTQVIIMGMSLEFLEELVERNHSEDSFNATTEECEHPFTVLYESSITEQIQQIAMCDVQHTVLPNTLMIAMVCRPRLILFDYPELRSEVNYTGFSSFLSLGAPEIVNPNLLSSIWKIKLLPWQRCVLVSQVVIDSRGKDLQTIGFSLFHLPDMGQTLDNPQSIQAQYLHGISVTGVYFSNLEEAWFSALRNPDKLLNCQFYSAPAPVSIFVTTKGPNGFIHLMLNPTAVPDEIVPVRQGRGRVNKFNYVLPLEFIRRETWKADIMSFSDILPGAYFSLVSFRPPMACALDKLGLGVPKEILRILGYRSQVRQHRLASVTTTGAYIHEKMSYVLEEAGFTHPWDHPDLVLPGDIPNDMPRKPFYLSAFSSPAIDASVSGNFKQGVTAIDFDESTGLLCYSVDKDTRLHFLDFGGQFRDGIKSSRDENGEEPVR